MLEQYIKYMGHIISVANGFFPNFFYMLYLKKTMVKLFYCTCRYNLNVFSSMLYTCASYIIFCMCNTDMFMSQIDDKVLIV